MHPRELNQTCIEALANVCVRENMKPAKHCLVFLAAGNPPAVLAPDCVSFLHRLVLKLLSAKSMWSCALSPGFGEST
jgi:hypothetical protein